MTQPKILSSKTTAKYSKILWCGSINCFMWAILKYKNVVLSQDLSFIFMIQCCIVKTSYVFFILLSLFPPQLSIPFPNDYQNVYNILYRFTGYRPTQIFSKILKYQGSYRNTKGTGKGACIRGTKTVEVAMNDLALGAGSTGYSNYFQYDKRGKRRS